MASYKNKLQEYAQKLRLPMPVYESVNEGFDHQPNFKCFVTVNGLRYESSGAHKHKKDAEQSAAEAAIQDLYGKDSDYQFEEAIGKKLLTEQLVKMGLGSPTFSVTKMGVAHSPIFTSTVKIGGASYVGGTAKSKREAETKAAFVAFQTIKEQIGDPHFQLQLQAESRASHELKQPTKECKDNKPELKTITNSCAPCSKLLVGTNPKQAESFEMSIMENAHAVEKGPGKSNANDENSAPLIEPHNQHEQENFLILQEQEETEVQKGVQKVNLKDSINKRSRSDSENCEQMSGKIKKAKKKKGTTG